jgi:XTP/dITP diphosphohydrolase
LKPHALPEYLEGRTPKEKHPFLFQKKSGARKTKNARSVFSFGVAGVLASAWGFLRAYDSIQSHHALRAWHISGFGNGFELGTINTQIGLHFFLFTIEYLKTLRYMKIILSTRNPSKATQIKAMFNNPSITILTLSEAGIEGDAIEDGTTLEENAYKKAIYAWDNLKEKTWVVAEDTGLFITALGGKPGIKAARWAGETATTDEIMNYTLKQLEGVTDRSAYFETVVILLSPDGTKVVFKGKVDGTLLEKPSVKPQPKMPYSPLFMPNGSDKVWAEMSIKEENEISHRGKAFQKVVKFLETQL